MDANDQPALDQELESYAVKLGPAMVAYWHFHRDRFKFEAELLSRHVAGLPPGKKIRLLDIGPSFQTMMFHRMWKDRVKIDTFGFADPKFPAPEDGQHFAFDLNDAYYPERWPQMELYDMIAMFEVIEHLYTSPVQVLRCLKSLTARGGIIAISTPNAVNLRNRAMMLLGRNPFECIRETRDNPGHYRESTRQELCEMGEAAGLVVKEAFVLNLCSTGSLPSPANEKGFDNLAA